MEMDIHLFDLITPGLIGNILNTVLVQCKKSDERINIFIGNTRTEKTIFPETLAAANNFYATVKNLPNIHTIAGPDVEQIGFILFLSCANRSMAPSVLFKIPWNESTCTLLMNETGKRKEKILPVLNGKNTINAFQAMEIGICNTYYVGLISRDHRHVMARIIRAP